MTKPKPALTKIVACVYQMFGDDDKYLHMEDTGMIYRLVDGDTPTIERLGAHEVDFLAHKLLG